MSVHTFGVEAPDSKEFRHFVKVSGSNASGPGLHETFAQWLIRPVPAGPGLYAAAVSVSSTFPDAWKLAAGLLLLPLVFTGLTVTWWLMPGALLWAFSFLASSRMRYYVMRMGMRKYGVEGRVRYLNAHELLRRLLSRGAV